MACMQHRYALLNAEHINDPTAETSLPVELYCLKQGMLSFCNELSNLLVILNNSWVRKDLSQGHQLLASLTALPLSSNNRANKSREGCNLLPQSTGDPITVIMVTSVGKTLMTTSASSSECHLIKERILSLPWQQHKCPHCRPCFPSVIAEC